MYTNPHIDTDNENYPYSHLVMKALETAVDDVLWLCDHHAAWDEDDVVGFTHRVVSGHSFEIPVIRIDDGGYTYEAWQDVTLAECCDLENAADTVETRVLASIEAY